MWSLDWERSIECLQKNTTWSSALRSHTPVHVLHGNTLFILKSNVRRVMEVTKIICSRDHIKSHPLELAWEFCCSSFIVDKRYESELRELLLDQFESFFFLQNQATFFTISSVQQNQKHLFSVEVHEKPQSCVEADPPSALRSYSLFLKG